jgi:hypothetical protein
LCKIEIHGTPTKFEFFQRKTGTQFMSQIPTMQIKSFNSRQINAGTAVGVVRRRVLGRADRRGRYRSKGVTSKNRDMVYPKRRVVS